VQPTISIPFEAMHVVDDDDDDHPTTAGPLDLKPIGKRLIINNISYFTRT
jgi:hypothetical protein